MSEVPTMSAEVNIRDMITGTVLYPRGYSWLGKNHKAGVYWLRRMVCFL